MSTIKCTFTKKTQKTDRLFVGMFTNKRVGLIVEILTNKQITGRLIVEKEKPRPGGQGWK
jgi:hypothetical protein